VDGLGRIQIQVVSSPEDYYVLYVRPDLQGDVEWPVSVTVGREGMTTLTEPLAAYPEEHYRVAQYRRDDPADTDGDGMDDVEEWFQPNRFSPLNPAAEMDIRDGTVSIADRATFEKLSYQGLDVKIDKHLENLEFVKFYILEADTARPRVLFMNTQTHRAHMMFARKIGFPSGRRGASIPGQMRGEIVYHPNVIAPSGLPGVYRFEFEPNDSYSFEDVRMAYELLAANMPVLQNNLVYYPMPAAALPRYYREKERYDSSRVAVLLEEDIYARVNYLALNVADGYGLLRPMSLNERPNARDIAIYDALPNELSRVGGIITTVPQTPLSHVNLRAVQDSVPNAYIHGALDNEAIAGLVGKHVYYRVDADKYVLREATLAEVEAHYAAMRPAEPQVPVRDLSVTAITPLDEITFEQWSSFGVKTANLATLRAYGFPEGTVPDGFGVPFYFYDEFIKYNGFYDQAEAMLADPDFQEDYGLQEAILAEFRKVIKTGDMPKWMWDALTDLQASFPEGTSIRCRSSTNHEDLPGFSGAGLYDSKTQHPDEGHISKCIKQVYASLWNFRAFDERQFHRIDHIATSMGVLVHPNFSNEKANGVAVTTDPVYQTRATYYLNTQLGENLVTHPEALSIPEEVLLHATAGYTLVRPSNQVADGEQILSEAHLDELRAYLGILHAKFRDLYGSEGRFAVEVEFKITSEDVLTIKQVRPWVW
jgi:hypothetical protein